jgi:hypothetical protein
MKTLSIILASAITTAPPALEPAAMHLEPWQAVQCKADGGCFVFNVPGLEAAIQEAYDAGTREKCGRCV